MLPDYERKVLRILYNYINQRLRMPSIKELEIKTGQDSKRIKEALLLLEDKNFINWEDKTDTAGIVIIKGWEDDSDIPKEFQSSHGTIEYWTEY